MGRVLQTPEPHLCVCSLHGQRQAEQLLPGPSVVQLVLAESAAYRAAL